MRSKRRKECIEAAVVYVNPSVSLRSTAPRPGSLLDAALISVADLNAVCQIRKSYYLFYAPVYAKSVGFIVFDEPHLPTLSALKTVGIISLKTLRASGMNSSQS